MDTRHAAVAPQAWRSFSVGPPGGPLVSGGPIVLEQVDGRTFRLASEIRYDGVRTGLEKFAEFKDHPALLDQARDVRPEHLRNGGCTDLASVPTPLQWFASRYGVYTAAALIHDRLISGTAKIDGMKDVYADRYFRYMLLEAGVGKVKASMMWAAVALRTRWEAGGWRRATLVLWLALAVAGSVELVRSAILGDWAMVVLAGVVVPAVSCALWGKQFGAGLVIAPAIPFVAPPVALVLVVSGLLWLADEPWSLRARRRRQRMASAGSLLMAGAPAETA